jgi:exodeoxyribonuclease V alpha subunit
LTDVGLRGVSLETSHRMRGDEATGRSILEVARAIDRGDLLTWPTEAHNALITTRPQVAEVTFQGAEFLSCTQAPNVLDEFLERWHREVLWSLPKILELTERDYALVDGCFPADDQDALRELFASWGRCRILCLTRVLPSGADRINAVLHEHTLAIHDRQTVVDVTFVPGEPVMMQINDYNRGIFNGDQGLVLNVSDGNSRQSMAVFPRSDGFAAFHIDSLRPVLVHSYAMTVHKSQGSEFDRVALVLPDRDIPINTREILYTALTRSRSGVVIIGRRDILEMGIARKIDRDCGIADKLGTHGR